MRSSDDLVLERLRAANPVTDSESATEQEIEQVIAAARASGSNGRTGQHRVVSRRLLLGGVAASAVGLAASSAWWREEPAAAAPLRLLAHEVATASPPATDVLYARWHKMAVETTSLRPNPDPDDTRPEDAISVRTVWTIEEWHPLWPQAYRPYQLENTTSEYLTPDDAERAARLSPEQRRSWWLPPEGMQPRQTTPKPGCARVNCSWALPDHDAADDPPTFANPTAAFVRDLPAEPRALKKLIETDPTLDRFGNYHWSPRDTWNRLVHWDRLRDERYGAILLGLLSYVPTPQAVRAALIELLADVDSVVVYGNRRVGNRTGVALGYLHAQPPSDAIVIDRETGLVIHERLTLTQRDNVRPSLAAGAVLSETSLLELAYVSAVGDRH